MKQKLSYVVGSKKDPLVNTTIGELLRHTGSDKLDNTALISVHQKLRLSYRELEELSNDFAKGLAQLGLEKGDRIGIWSPNNYQWIVTMYAAAKIGLILVNVNPAYRASELQYALNKVACKALVLADSFKSSNYPSVLEQIAPEVSASKSGEGRFRNLPHLESLILISDTPRRGYLVFDQVMADGASSSIDLDPLRSAIDCSMPVNIQFTSGTTGEPKGATLSHYNVVNNGTNVGRGIGLRDRDKVCAPVPLYHCFGMVLAALACASHRATLVLPNDSFDPISTLHAVTEEKCTALYGVPTMFSAMLDHPEFRQFDLSSLRTGIVAGSLCAEPLMKRIIKEMHMPEITNCYGMTETSPVSFQSAVDDPLNKRVTTVGTIHPHVVVKIIDDSGKILSRGNRGELCTKGYSVMEGYWNDESRTRESIINGWMHTGDEAQIDDEGYCAIVGRIKDTIIRGGENIAPKEIEDYLIQHKSISEAQAFGVSDEKYGEIVCVWLKTTADSHLNQSDVQEFCKDKIAYFKIPAFVKFVDEFPLTVTGKVQKFVMRELTEKELNSKQ